jgi:hypothetical protein
MTITSAQRILALVEYVKIHPPLAMTITLAPPTLVPQQQGATIPPSSAVIPIIVQLTPARTECAFTPPWTAMTPTPALLRPVCPLLDVLSSPCAAATVLRVR